MVVLRRAEPKDGRKTIHDALRVRLPRATHMPSLDGTPQTAAPLPMYRISAAAAVGSKPLSRARHVGWQYPLLGGKRPGLVSLMRKRSGLAYGGVIEGHYPERFLQAALLAEHELGDDVKTYEPRLLHVPSLQLHVLWLFQSRGSSRFISLSERQQVKPLVISDEIDLLMHRRGRAPTSKPRPKAP